MRRYVTALQHSHGWRVYRNVLLYTLIEVTGKKEVKSMGRRIKDRRMAGKTGKRQHSG
jgi:hypothetical protein